MLQKALRAWQPALRNLKVAGVLRWNVEVDPLDI
jgi:primosomal protein N' (replication factor Y) (superfamily II helicase)